MSNYETTPLLFLCEDIFYSCVPIVSVVHKQINYFVAYKSVFSFTTFHKSNAQKTDILSIHNLVLTNKYNFQLGNEGVHKTLNLNCYMEQIFYSESTISLGQLLVLYYDDKNAKKENGG